ncbi:hypothetical protein FRC09_020525 [Ceratobasidium sp. 395]|nr:hypothetical protein FRC09_020525 [Ceratobasidium sp. 395]
MFKTGNPLVADIGTWHLATSLPFSTVLAHGITLQKKFGRRNEPYGLQSADTVSFVGIARITKWADSPEDIRRPIPMHRSYRGAGGHETINRLAELLQHANQYFFDSRNQDWKTALFQNPGFDQFIMGMANELDAVLGELSRYLGTAFTPTGVLINQAREEDRNYMDQFVNRIDRASPAPGPFASAYRNRDVNQLDNFVERIFDEQTDILSASPELRSEDFQGAQNLTNLIMNVTKKKPDPKILLGRGFVGKWKPLRSTFRYDLSTAEYVTGETVVIKALRDRINGKDRQSQLPRFQKHAEVWSSLRSDYTLPFHGIGMSEQNNQMQIYSVSPYLQNGDAATYRKHRQISAAEWLQIALDVAMGLQYLHSKRPAIVHGGVRTDNILIDDSGRGVLAGFGLTEEADDIPTAQTGITNDSYRFLPPERLSDTPFPRKTSADVWMWAMIALDLVGGKPPFCDSGDLPAAQLINGGQKPKRENYPKIEEISSPEKFWQILEDCWAQDETQRQDMEDVVYRMKKLPQRNEVYKPVPVRPGDLTSVDEEPVDGRIQPPVAQGPARRGQR